ncbi:MAG: COG4280 domain-containing protein [Lacisediminihabitans sp.]
MTALALFISVFLASAVEAVEATTIVLAAGTARHWRSALLGVAAGILLLAVVIGVAGPAISLLPLGALRLVVGGLLLVFGLQWLRKAILRASGYKALHDENAIYRAEVAAVERASVGGRYGVRDWFAFTLSFKGVLLEGLEVAFIALTFGTNQHDVPLAALAAIAAIVVVVLLGIAVRAPLARVPENTLKFIVGVMLTAFGIFWGAEGAGAQWPAADVSLLVLVPTVALFAFAIVAVLRATPRSRAASKASVSTSAAGILDDSVLVADMVPIEELLPPVDDSVPQRPTALSRLKGFGMFWYDFVVGDDLHVAGGVVIAFLLTFWLSVVHVANWWLVPVAIALLVPYSLWRAVRLRH